MRPLSYGLQNVIPDDAVAAWGCRAILKNGFVDIVPDRKDMVIPEQYMVNFGPWLNDVMSDEGWVDLTAATMKGDRDEVKAYDLGPFHIRMSTNASYGYLYISAWMEV